MKKICIMTGTRAEYGLLKNLIKRLQNNDKLNCKVVVTGAHLSPEFGLTYKEIEQDRIKIDQKIEMLMSSDTPIGISKSIGLAIISFSEYFDREKFDLLIVLGDRYETLAVCIAAMNARIPIAHIHGGETTEGAIDECIRHSVTKMSYLHFTSAEQYRKRVIQLGENPKRVFNVGALGVENILNTKLLQKSELEESLNYKLDKPYGIITFHPVTLEKNTSKIQFNELLRAISRYKNMKFIFTKSNSDSNGRIINSMIDEYTEKNDNVVAFESLGMLRYLSAVKYSKMVIGNSSSGIIEVPVFGIPTVNIGDRQKGRIHGETVIDCKPLEDSIIIAMDKANNENFRNMIKSSVSLFGNGHTSEKIENIIIDYLYNEEINLKKKFYDIDF